MAGASILCSIVLFSCSGNTSTDTATDTTANDPKKVADEVNEKKLDSTDLKEDAEFAVKIADAGMLEVQLGKLALTNASSPKVKEFAKMMIDDHTKAGNELKEAASKKNIMLPVAMSDKCQKKYDELAEKKGKDFDKDYISAMVDGHEDVLKEMKDESEKGKDGDLRLWASGKVAVVSHHLEVAKSTKETLK